jgi:hypothetical protein
MVHGDQLATDLAIALEIDAREHARYHSHATALRIVSSSYFANW